MMEKSKLHVNFQGGRVADWKLFYRWQ